MKMTLRTNQYLHIFFEENEVFETNRTYSHGDLVKSKTASITKNYFSFFYGRNYEVFEFMLKNIDNLKSCQKEWFLDCIQKIKENNSVTGCYSDHIAILN